MHRLDELHLEFPFFGSRKLALELRKEGVLINRKRVQRLMRLMGIVAMVPQPNTSKPAPEHKKFPYPKPGKPSTSTWTSSTTDASISPSGTKRRMPSTPNT
jgi:putative transposase